MHGTIPSPVGVEPNVEYRRRSVTVQCPSQNEHEELMKWMEFVQAEALKGQSKLIPMKINKETCPGRMDVIRGNEPYIGHYSLAPEATPSYLYKALIPPHQLLPTTPQITTPPTPPPEAKSRLPRAAPFEGIDSEVELTKNIVGRGQWLRSRKRR